MLMQKIRDLTLGAPCVHVHSVARRGLAGWLAMLAVVWASQPAGNALAADTNSPADPVVSLLLEKGVITQDEAAKAEAQIAADRTNEPAPYLDSKWKISSGLKSVELFGDIRLRYEDREVRNSSGDINLKRFRYAVRLGLRGEAADDFYYGLRLETSSNPRSSMSTFGTSSSGLPYSGPYGKSTDGINVGQVYLGWKPESWFDVVAGKMPNPLYTSSMVWSPSLSPEGFAEKLNYNVGPANFFSTFGQFLYMDINPAQTSGGFFSSLGDYSGSSLPFQLAWQLGVDYQITKKLDFKIAPAIYDYVGNPADTSGTAASPYTPGFGGVYVGQGAATGGASGYPLGQYDGYYANQTGINDLLVLEIPFELNYKMDKFDVRAFGDYAQNLSGASRAEAAYTQSHNPIYDDNQTPIEVISSPQTKDNKAYQAGVAIGSPGALGLVNGTVSQRHGWEVRSYWQHIEQYSLDPNLIDLDFFSGQENLQGIYAAAAYGFSDNIIGTFRYGYASRINRQLGTGGSGTDIPQMNPVNQYDIFQVDLTLKF